MKRVLHVVGKMDRAGAETMLMNLYRNIDRSQIQFDFIVFSRDKGDFDDEILAMGGRLIPIIGRNFINQTWNLMLFLRKNREQYSIIHSHTLLNSGLTVLIARIAKIPYRITHSHNENDTISKEIVRRIYIYISKLLIDCFSTHRFACGEAAAKFLFLSYQDTLIIPNSVNVETLAQKRQRKDNTEKENPYKILQVGRLEDVKNHRFTIRLVDYMKEQGYEFKLFFVGQGRLEEDLKSEVCKKRLTDVIEFMGLRTDVLDIMADADVMIMPSVHEGFPVTLVESQAIGLPAVISDTISKEVDLGVGLVEFNSLNNTFDSWISLLMKEQCYLMSKMERIAILKDKNFDVVKNAMNLLEIYKSMN